MAKSGMNTSKFRFDQFIDRFCLIGVLDKRLALLKVELYVAEFAVNRNVRIISTYKLIYYVVVIDVELV